MHHDVGKRSRVSYHPCSGRGMGVLMSAARAIVESRRSERPVNSLASAADIVESKVVVVAARSEVAGSEQ